MNKIPAAEISARNDRWQVSEWDRKVLPVLVSAGILAYYAREVQWHKLVEVSQRANLFVAFTAVVIPQVVSWFLGALIVERSLHWFHSPFPLRAYFWVRGASYILAFVNSALHGGGLLLYQKYRAEITWTKLIGIILFRTGLIYWSIGLFMIPATMALHRHGLAEKAFGSRAMLYVWWGVLIIPGFLFLIANWDFWFGNRDVTRLGKLIVRNRRHEFWTAFHRSSLRHWLLIWAMFLPSFFASVVAFHVLNLTFDIRVPLAEAIVVLPFAFVIMDLPIAFGGFGTMTLAWMTFFGDYGSLESIAALTLFVPSARILCRMGIGAISLKPALDEINGLLRASERDDEALPSPG